MSKLKNFIKTIPFLGDLSVWIYSILKSVNTKRKVQSLEGRIEQKLIVQEQKFEQKLMIQEQKFNKLKVKFETQEQFADDLVRKHITSQLIYFHQKVDKFIENADQEKAINLKNAIDQNFFDEYYLNFENKFRGSRESILKRYESYLDYVPFLNNHTDQKSLDIGCGRGEWVQLLQNKGIESHGIDQNPMMLKLAYDNELKNIQNVDAFEYLKNVKKNTFDLITAFHIIEHIPFEKLVYLLQEIKRVAKPNATMLLETPNPNNLQVAACNFYTDPTHLNPLPANMIQFLVEYIGFVDVKVHYLNPNNIKEKAQDYLIVAKNPHTIYEDTVKKKILFDISLYYKTNLKTGIHRVVSQQLKALKVSEQKNYEIIPVIYQEQKNCYTGVENETSPINPTAGDILFTSDLSYEDIQKATQNGLYDEYKEKGVKIVFLIHDILPILYEHYFAKGTKQKHETYIQDISKVADLLFTTTKIGKKDLKNYLCFQNLKSPKIKILPLGANITPIDKNKIEKPPSHIATQHMFLMVGTVEPRKAYNQVLEAFTSLWEKNPNNTNAPILTIIGKKGWLVEDTLKMIQNHPLLNKNLFYLDKVSDDELYNYYEKAHTLILASHAEGFGLPLIEAIYHKKHIIARDIPVFREIAGNYCTYFKDTKNSSDIISAIKSSLEETNKKQKTNNDKHYKAYSWQEHTKLLLEYLKKVQ